MNPHYYLAILGKKDIEEVVKRSLNFLSIKTLKKVCIVQCNLVVRLSKLHSDCEIEVS